jgi:hypothetical protein
MPGDHAAGKEQSGADQHRCLETSIERGRIRGGVLRQTRDRWQRSHGHQTRCPGNAIVYCTRNAHVPFQDRTEDSGADRRGNHRDADADERDRREDVDEVGRPGVDANREQQRRRR